KNLSDEQLVLQYKNGNALAFDEIYNRYKSLVKYFCRNLFLIGAESEDMVQEGMLGLFNAVSSYSEGQSSFSTYATVCIKNKLLSAVKKYSNNKNSVLNNTVSTEVLDNLQIFANTPEDFVLFKENGKELKNKLTEQLSKTENKVLKLFLEGLSYEEIAEKTGVKIKSVDNALTRARKKIINFIGE
ncbi:MAG: sigma-70 family RNA polymerase sigma factor, partial [Clostridia bacterium]|nr:sigma-70 family RNA polymerase sigma factor [Clostridia bacterium]